MRNEDVARAFVHRESAKILNSSKVRAATGAQYRCSTDGTRYWLHGEIIAWHANMNGEPVVVFDWCGYYTVTTLTHMGAIAKHYGAATPGYAAAKKEGLTTFSIEAWRLQP